jgi:alpha-beta hydrolase superfamily lysophospholipase
VPAQIEGGVLLIHGLTDSPYSMKSLAEIFYAANFYVLSLRMPGHGTIPAALNGVSWKDWLAAARVGARHVHEKAGEDKPFFMAGYSNGAAVSLLYTLDSLKNKDMVSPDHVFLLSPAIGISELARMAYWLKFASILPGFEKAKWQSVFPEYDPFKYNSFPLNAATQSYTLSKVIQKRIDKMKADGSLSRLPAVTTFQSVVDSTVIAKDVLAAFYDKLSPGGHEVIAFGTNQNVFLENFLKTPPIESLSTRGVHDKLSYTLTLITNDRESQEVIARTKEANKTEWHDTPLNVSWPESVYSLSHVALPFPMDDGLYGLHPVSDSNDHIQLGNVYLRGEKHALRISESNLMRFRCNPFWDYVKIRVNDVIRDSKGDLQ